MAAPTKAPPRRKWLSMRQYALEYGITRTTVAKWRAEGLLRCYAVHRCVRVRNQEPFPHARIPI